MSSKYILGLAFLLSGCQSLPTHTETDGSELTKTVPQAMEATDHQDVAPVAKPQVVKKAEELTPQEQENLWNRIAMQFTLEIPEDPSIDYYRNWYLKHPEHLKTVSERATPFLYMITTRIEEQGLPLELALLPIVESSFDPFAYSFGSAAGLWQFIPMTADRFGLERDYWYDGRRDVSASTDAALEYMTYLNKFFDGNWTNAIAAYNSGEGRVANAIKKNKRAGKSTDFEHLDLPKETRSYVPKLLALADILANQDKYGVKAPLIPNQPVLTLVDPEEQLDLSIAARYAGISVKELQSYNPAYNQWATSPNGPHSFLIPVGSVDRFNQQVAENRGKGIKLYRYKVKAGDTLSVIAAKNRTTSKAIQTANNLNSSTIRIGQYLLVPQSSKDNDKYTLTAENRLQKMQSTSNGKYKVNYTVTSGDSLWRIAKQQKVSISSLARWNGMAPNDPLRIGQKLVIWQEEQGNSVIRTVYYNVRSGDTIGAIASKFKVQTNQVLNWNSLDLDDYLQPGQKLKLYVDVTKAGSA